MIKRLTLILTTYTICLLTALAQPTCEIKTFGMKDGLQTTHITDFLQDSHGTMWFASWNGLVCYDGYRFVTIENPTDHARLARIYEDRDGSILCQTIAGSTSRYYPRTNTWQPLKRQAAPLPKPKNRVKMTSPFTAAEWGATYDRQETIPLILDAMKDRDGNVWCTSQHGLHLIIYGYQHFRHNTLEQHMETRSLGFDADGTLWAGNSNGLLATYAADGKGGMLTPSATHDFSGARIYFIFQDRQHRHWISTKGNGLYVISTDGKVTNYRHDTEQPYSISHDYVYGIYQDSRGAIYIGTYGGGLNIVTAEDVASGNIRFHHAGNDIQQYPRQTNSCVRRITATADGTIILSTTNGIVTFPYIYNKVEDIKFTTYPAERYSQLKSMDIMQTIVTQKGRILLATMQGDVVMAVPADHYRDITLQKLTSPESHAPKDGHTGIIYGMQEDHNGSVWVVRENYLQRIDTVSHISDVFYPFGWGRHTELTETQPVCSAADGMMAVGTMGGFITFQPKDLMLSKAAANGKKQGSKTSAANMPEIVFPYLQYAGAERPVPLLYADTLVITPDHRSLDIYLSTLSYTTNAAIHYAYKMDGVDDDWRYTGTEHCASYTNLPPGYHTLYVSSTDANGIWQDNCRTLTVYVSPTFWESWMAKVLYLLIAAFAAYLIWRHYDQRRKAAYRENILKKRVEEIVIERRILQQTLQQMEEKVATQDSAKPDYHLGEAVIVDEEKEFMDRVLTYVEEHLSDGDMHIDDIAQAIAMNRNTLAAKIKDAVGMTPVDFIRQLRMQRAIDLVSHSTMRVSEIAFAVGFNDQRYFSRVFKKETGLSPSEYRQTQSEEKE